jgi:hypothetical protein
MPKEKGARKTVPKDSIYSGHKEKGPAYSRVVIRVIEAEKLLASDYETGKSDPVCFVVYRAINAGIIPLSETELGEEQMAELGIQTTKVCKTTVDPKWNDEISFKIDASDVKILSSMRCLLFCRDEDIEPDNSRTYQELGMLEIPIRDIVANGTVVARQNSIVLSSSWYTLQKSPGMPKVDGSIKLTISIIFVPEDFDMIANQLVSSGEIDPDELTKKGVAASLQQYYKIVYPKQSSSFSASGRPSSATASPTMRSSRAAATASTTNRRPSSANPSPQRASASAAEEAFGKASSSSAAAADTGRRPSSTSLAGGASSDNTAARGGKARTLGSSAPHVPTTDVAGTSHIYGVAVGEDGDGENSKIGSRNVNSGTTDRIPEEVETDQEYKEGSSPEGGDQFDFAAGGGDEGAAGYDVVVEEVDGNHDMADGEAALWSDGGADFLGVHNHMFSRKKLMVIKTSVARDIIDLEGKLQALSEYIADLLKKVPNSSKSDQQVKTAEVESSPLGTQSVDADNALPKTVVDTQITTAPDNSSESKQKMVSIPSLVLVEKDMTEEELVGRSLAAHQTMQILTNELRTKQSLLAEIDTVLNAEGGNINNNTPPPTETDLSTAVPQAGDECVIPMMADAVGFVAKEIASSDLAQDAVAFLKDSASMSMSDVVNLLSDCSGFILQALNSARRAAKEHTKDIAHMIIQDRGTSTTMGFAGGIIPEGVAATVVSGAIIQKQRIKSMTDSVLYQMGRKRAASNAGQSVVDLLSNGPGGGDMSENVVAATQGKLLRWLCGKIEKRKDRTAVTICARV